MAARPKSGISIDTDVNLDFLTKEEKEALLSKKMDMIRQRNKALTERHQLIEADKKKAEEAGQAVKPTVDSQMFPAEGAPKPRGRGRGQTHIKDGNRPMKERPKSSGDLRDSSNYEPIVDTTDLANYRSKGHGGLHEREAPNNAQKSKKKSKEEASVYPSNCDYEPIIEMKDLDQRFGPLLNLAEARMWPHIDHGPPPDPSFNPLADRRRSDKKEDAVDHRRHPRNYGGTSDLSRVKQNMKNLREKEKERPQGSKPLDIVMTGKERRNHEDWKAERDRYDKERIQRQMSDGGNWKRAWDADKMSTENEEQSSYSLKMEPAKRPAGRIGSGRFDRGDRDDHPRGAVLVKATLPHSDHLQQQQQQWHHHDQQQLPAHQHNSLVGENKPSRGRGRGRGRGRSRGGSGDKFPRPRTWSGGDDRFVECQKELLLVKFDNTAGDNSVEVEYDDDEILPSPPNTSKSPQPATTQGRGPTGRTPNQASKQQARGVKPQQQKSKTSRHKEGPQINSQQISTESKWNHSAAPQTGKDQDMVAYGREEIHVLTPSHSQEFRDAEEWEDDTEASAAHEENDSGISSMVQSSTTTSSSIHDLHLECRLNPEAPEFLPSTTDMVKTPTGPANTSPWNSTSRSSSPLSQDSSISPQLAPRLSTSPYSHSAIHLQESSAKLLRKEVDTTFKNGQPSLRPCEESQLLARKQANVDDHSSPEVPRPTNKPSEITGAKLSCFASNGSGTKDTILTSKTIDRANALLDALGKARKDALESNKVALSLEKTTTGNISASLLKRMTDNSLSDDSKIISTESATSLAAENPQDNEVVKDLMQDVSETHDSSEETSRPVTNNDRPDQQKLNGLSAVSEDHKFAKNEHGVVGDSLKDSSSRPEDLATHEHGGSLQGDAIAQKDLATNEHRVRSLKDSSNRPEDLATRGHGGSLQGDTNAQKDLATNEHGVRGLKDDSNRQEDLATHEHGEVVGSLQGDANGQKDLATNEHGVRSLKDSSNRQEDLATHEHGEVVGSLQGDANAQKDPAINEHHVALGSLREDCNGQEDLTTHKQGVGSLNGDAARQKDLAKNEHDVALGSLKEDSSRQEDLKAPAVTAKICGPCDPSQVSELNGSQKTPKADESALPTADNSAVS